MNFFSWGWVKVGAALGLLAVALGAFGAHGLGDRLESLGTLAIYQTAVQYHMIHALAILAVGVLSVAARPSASLNVTGFLFLSGVLVFSGSLYLFALTGVKWYGRITPLGGLFLMAGWWALASAGPGRAAAAAADQHAAGVADRRAEPLAEERR